MAAYACAPKPFDSRTPLVEHYESDQIIVGARFLCTHPTENCCSAFANSITSQEVLFLLINFEAVGVLTLQ